MIGALGGAYGQRGALGSGYHYFAEYGNIFLENRYTDWGNYYPHHTLRNLWHLSRYVPPERLQIEDTNEQDDPDRPWLVIVWNDPINLMSYVTWVFQKLFGYSKSKATKLMLDVHHKGRAVVAKGTREEMERDVEILHSYGLWATVKRDD